MLNAKQYVLSYLENPAAVLAGLDEATSIAVVEQVIKESAKMLKVEELEAAEWFEKDREFLKALVTGVDESLTESDEQLVN